MNIFENLNFVLFQLFDSCSNFVLFISFCCFKYFCLARISLNFSFSNVLFL